MAAPRPAKDIKPTDARTKLLKKMQQDKLRRDAKQFNKQAKAQAADKKIRPAKDIKSGDMRSKFLKEAKAGNIKAATTSSTARIGAKGLIKRIPVVGAALGFISDASPAGSPQERSWERRNTEQRRMKGKVSGMGFTGGTVPSGKKDSKFKSSRLNPVLTTQNIRKYTIDLAKTIKEDSKSKNKTSMPSVSMAGGGGNYPAAGQKKSSSGVNQFAIAAGNAKDKKKAGATTGAAPAGTGANPKRKSWFQRRQAERYAIGSSGKSL